jgi:hypothetical protein
VADTYRSPADGGATSTENKLFGSLRRDFIAFLSIIVLLMSLGMFCVHLSTLFYQNHGAFFDSLSYNETLLRVMMAIRAGLPSVAFSSIFESTVALPWLEALLIAPFAEPSRAIGVWIQTSWIIVTSLTGYVYFRRVIRTDRITATCLSLLPFLIACTFSWNGSLSDFRMDYFQYILIGLVLYSYLFALADGRLWVWLLWGVATGLACLARATTPVYIVLIFAPFAMIDLWKGRRTGRSVFIRYSIGFVSCVAVCGWFYLKNFSYLYYYYFIWNTAANAKLPLTESFRHTNYLYEHVGTIGTVMCLLLFSLNVAQAILSRAPFQWNLRPLWCGIAPLGFLILSGAGLNPFVSETAAFGLILFAISPVIPSDPGVAPRGRTSIAVLCTLIMAYFGATRGLLVHADNTGRYIPSWVPTRAAIDKVVDCIANDIGDKSDKSFAFTTLYIGSLNTDVIMSSFLFDEHFPIEMQPTSDLSARIGKASLHRAPFRVDTLVTPVEWNAVPGPDDRSKVEFLSKNVAAAADYFIIPTVGSTLPDLPINKYAAPIIDRVSELAVLRPLCEDIKTSENEFVGVYRKDSPDHQMPDGTARGWHRQSRSDPPSGARRFPGGEKTVAP